HRPTRSPSVTVHVTSSSNTRSPKRLVRPESWITTIQLTTDQSGGTTDLRVDRTLARHRFGLAETARRCGEKALSAKRLEEVTVDAKVDSLNGAGFRRMSGDDNDREIGGLASRLANHRETVHARHLEIGHEQIDVG